MDIADIEGIIDIVEIVDITNIIDITDIAGIMNISTFKFQSEHQDILNQNIKLSTVVGGDSKTYLIKDTKIG